MTTRKGASSRAAIPAKVLKELNAGRIETATLSEGLAIDFAALLQNAVPGSDVKRMHEGASLGVTRRMDLAAEIAAEHLGTDAFLSLSSHGSDTVRGWGAFVLGRQSMPLRRKLQLIKPLADDAHFGVREWAWLALRGDVAREPEKAIQLLTSWTEHRSANVRRFATEITRPRGVWCAHIPKLREQPEAAEELLDRVMEDESRYVQNSCANWLNDAGKTRPDWLKAFCEKWRRRSDSEPVHYIVRRGLRNCR